VKTRTWFRVHSFTGVMTGLMLFVICWSGTFAVLSHELDWLVTPDLRVEATGERASWGTLAGAVLEAYPEGEVLYMVRSPLPRGATEVWVGFPDGSSRTVEVDPYMAKVLEVGGSDFDLQEFFRGFHTTLFALGPSLGGEQRLGSYVVFTFGLVLLVSVVSALFLYKRWWTRFFEFRRGRKGRAYWTQVHKLTGVWSLWFLLVIGGTGTWYFIEGVRLDFGDGKVNWVGEVPFGAVQPPTPTSDPSLPRLPLDTLVERAQAAWPGLEIQTVAWGWYSPSSDVLYLGGQADAPLVRERANQMQLDPRTGEVLWRSSAGDLPPYWLWSNMADPLHFGNFGGLASKLIWFVFGLAISGLILSGTYLHARRLGRHPAGAGRHRWPGTAAATVVWLIALGASVAAGFEYAEWYGPTVDGVQQRPSLGPGVRAVIVGWSGLTLAILAGWIWMLWRPESLEPREDGGGRAGAGREVAVGSGT
jgi:uncharacterized iron-regulated membrane protein